MTQITRAEEVMTFPVHTVKPADPLRKVIALLCRYRISGVPVVNGAGQLVGLISERDILEAMYPNQPELRQRRRRVVLGEGVREVGSIKAQAIMVREVVTATPDTDVLRLASMMAARKIRRIPIVDGKRLVGIVSQGDVYRAIFERGRAQRETEENNNGILSRHGKP
jgi:CBS domain-containing protein